MKKTIVRSLAVLCIATFVLVGCGKNGEDINESTGKTTTQETKEALQDSDEGKMKVDTETKASPKAPAELKLQQAYEVYSEKYPDSQIKEMSLEEESSRYIYKFEGVKDGQAHEMKIDAEDLSIIKDGLDDNIDKDDNDVFFDFSEYSNVEEYVKNVLAENDGYHFKEWKVEEDDNQFVLKIDIRKDGRKIEYRINPSDGTVIEKK